jgi:DNA transposition AAA+ family ATPase
MLKITEYQKAIELIKAQEILQDLTTKLEICSNHYQEALKMYDEATYGTDNLKVIVRREMVITKANTLDYVKREFDEAQKNVQNLMSRQISICC